MYLYWAQTKQDVSLVTHSTLGLEICRDWKTESSDKSLRNSKALNHRYKVTLTLLIKGKKTNYRQDANK